MFSIVHGHVADGGVGCQARCGGTAAIVARARISAASVSPRRSGPKRLAGTEHDSASAGGSLIGRATARQAMPTAFSPSSLDRPRSRISARWARRAPRSVIVWSVIGSRAAGRWASRSSSARPGEQRLAQRRGVRRQPSADRREQPQLLGGLPLGEVHDVGAVALAAVAAVAVAGCGSASPRSPAPSFDAGAARATLRATTPLMSAGAGPLGYRVVLAPPRPGIEGDINREHRRITLFLGGQRSRTSSRTTSPMRSATPSTSSASPMPTGAPT